jgi:cytochrome c peroxidase
VRKQNPYCRFTSIVKVTLTLACACLTISAHSTQPANGTDTVLHPDARLVSGKINEPILPIKSSQTIHDERKIRLGEQLFHDERLDSKRKISCASCHNLKIGGTDRLAFSVNSAGRVTRFNTPTIFNVSLNNQYYWSGKFHSLDDQVDDALKEINTTWPLLLRTLNSIPKYVELFRTIYESNITKDNVKDAFISFELSLLTPDAPFDKYLNGNKNALTNNALQGYQLFKSYGCITCHQGNNIGGNMVINLSKIGAPFGYLHSTRYRLNGKLKRIRVPSLRNVAVTAPYFHDGSVTTLYQAVHRMIDEYSGMEVSDTNIYKIVSFLRSLTGQYKGESL